MKAQRALGVLRVQYDEWLMKAHSSNVVLYYMLHPACAYQFGGACAFIEKPHASEKALTQYFTDD